MNELINRFIKYVKIDTESVPDVTEFPSSSKQKDLGKLLVDELHQLGIDNAFMNDKGYVYAKIKGNVKSKKTLGLIAHMDTSSAVSGRNVCPQIIEKYDGTDIILSIDNGRVLSVKEYPNLLHYIGQDLIVTDGNTLLGADDKAGIAEIIQAVKYFIENKDEQHGDICIAFTPDEEVGRGAEFFDVKQFGADVAYTVDGGEVGEIEFENFNAGSLTVIANGKSIHPGSAKGIMKNSIELLMEFHSLLPACERPQYTEKTEGFYHLDEMSGDVTKSVGRYIIRDHDIDKYQQKKNLVIECAKFMNAKYGDNTICYEIKDSYFNMKEKILPHMYLIDIAKNCMTSCGVEPKIVAIRGGTDGARLSFMGLPCPNLSTGGENFHGYYEFISIQSMERMTQVLISIIKSFAE